MNPIILFKRHAHSVVFGGIYGKRTATDRRNTGGLFVC